MEQTTSMEQMADSAQQLQVLAESLKALVARFKVAG
jgi:methyl-accepting chemotaxis protein